MRTVHLAKAYGFEDKEINEMYDEGVNALIYEFSREISKWHGEVMMRTESRRSFGFRSCGVASDREFENERAAKTQRVRYIDQLAFPVQSLIELIDSFPEDKKAEIDSIKDRIYMACDNSPFDSFGIAISFEDNKLAFRYGLRIMQNGIDERYFVGAVDRVSDILMERVMPSADEETKKGFLSCYMFFQKRWSSGSEDVKDVARQLGLLEHLMKLYENSNDKRTAAEIAVELGDRPNACRLYAEAKYYPDAIEFADDDLDKVVLYFEQTLEQVNRNYGSCHFSGDVRERRNSELEIMQKGIGLLNQVNGQLREGEHRYVESAASVVSKLFEFNQYAEGCLFARESGLPEQRLRGFVSQDLVSQAEGEGDFAGCYHLDRLRGRGGESYKVLAQRLEQEIPDSLSDLVYVKP